MKIHHKRYGVVVGTDASLAQNGHGAMYYTHANNKPKVYLPVECLKMAYILYDGDDLKLFPKKYSRQSAIFLRHILTNL